MTKSNIQISALLAIAMIMLLVASALHTYRVASANASVSCYDTTSFDGTSTRAFMSPGAGTTTLMLSNCASGNLATSAFVQFQYTASTSGSVLQLRVEHSNDKVDWYPETVVLSTATTSNAAGDSLTYRFAMATTTDNGGTGVANRLHRSLSISTPTKYTRVIFTVPTAGNNGALWAEVIGRKEI